MAGCVDRTITINTYPQGAQVWLNDEFVGQSPTTVTFQWYGDYRIRIAKQGYQVLHTHQRIKAPWYDAFPFDFFAQVIWPGRLVDSHVLSFVLEPQVSPDRQALIDRASSLREELATEDHR